MYVHIGVYMYLYILEINLYIYEKISKKYKGEKLKL